MNKSTIEAGQPGTTVDSNSTAQNQQVSQPNANTNVVGSLFGQCEIKFIYTVVKPKIVFSSGPMTLEEIENGYAKRFLQMNGFLPMSHKVYKRRYIGLKDKSGKEIYEGDILRMSYSRDTTGKDIVVFSEVVEFQINEGTGTTGFEISFLRTSEIIGNVFENPELI